MKNLSLFLTMGLFILSFSVLAQVKVAGNGNVGINTTAPAFKLDLNSPESRSYYSNRNALHINHFGMDPRLCSNDKIVFFNLNATSHANIECRVLLQHYGNITNKNIESLENKGLAAIVQLRGVTYPTEDGIYKRKEHGFLTENMEEVIPEAVFKNDSTDEASIAYSYLLPYLVEAVKEQQVIIEELKGLVALMENRLNEADIVTIPSTIKPATMVSKAKLEQNIPNPFNHETKIGCFIPEKAKTSILYNYSMNGTPVGAYHLAGKGRQIVTLDGHNLTPGTYVYKLIIDGQEIGARKMLYTK